jgi:dihydrofolate synthase/folylpolyglutamate synthase
MPINNIEDVHAYLNAIPPFKSSGKAAADFSLDRFKEFCTAINNPQDQFPSIHVAGSNGKGSICQIIASIYYQAGYKTGLFTSPHLVSYDERFTINGKRISEAMLIEFFASHASLMKRYKLTYFEVSTALAFWWFARQQIDIAVIETGLGGRLDATNVITPLVSIITTITLDHTDILGDTIPEIAAEKAGIIKKNVPVVLGNIPAEARKVIYERAHSLQAPIYDSMKYEPKFCGDAYCLTVNGERKSLQSTLQTPVQAYNIAAAWQVTKALEDKLPLTDEDRREGIRTVRNLFTHQARFELLQPHLRWYFDGAHNIQAVQAMKNVVRTLQPVRETILVLSLMRDKINEEMITEFSEFKRILYYSLPLERAATMKELQQWLPLAEPFPTEQEAQNKIFKEFESELVIFAGSFYFYATVKEWIANYQQRP